MLACIFHIMQVTITIKTRPSKPINTIFSIEALLRKNVKTDIVLKMHIRKISIMYNGIIFVFKIVFATQI